MNLSYNWLRELVKTDASPEKLGEMLTNAGCAVEEMEQVGSDTLMVAEVTTNRPDWLCHNGVAHEIAALTGGELTLPKWELQEGDEDVNDYTSITVEDGAKEFCPRYTARVIRGVKVGESPAWLKEKLETLGQRSINNVVDVANYVMFEMNQPLHAFDYDLLKENRIVVRMAKDGERFKAITGEEEKLTSGMLVIADAERAVALAGVKGGEDTEVHDGTVNVLLESAWFQPQQVRRAGRGARMMSDSSYRFERGIDRGAVDTASARAAYLIQQLAGGTICKGIIDTGPDMGKSWELSMHFARCESVLGVEVEHVEIERIFNALGLETIHKDASSIKVKVPSFRADLTREIDLIEEVVRVAGFDSVPEKVTMPLSPAHVLPAVSASRIARDVLVGLGYYECVTDSFVREKWVDTMNPWAIETPVRVHNPVNNERPLLRTSLVPSLLEVRKNNRGEENVRLFEINGVYPGGDTSGKQLLRLCILDDRGTEYVRGALEQVVAALKVECGVTLDVVDSAKGIQDGTAARLLTKDSGVAFAVMGQVDEGQVKLHDLTLAPSVIEADLDFIATLPRAVRVFKPIARFPAIRRDIALVVDEAARWNEIEAVVRAKAELLEDLSLESVYRGKGIDKGKKSVAFSMVLRNAERSMTDEEANAMRDAVVEGLTSKFDGATLR